MGQTEEGKDRKVLTVCSNETCFMDYLRYLQPHLNALFCTIIWHVGKMFISNSNLTSCQQILF